MRRYVVKLLLVASPAPSQRVFGPSADLDSAVLARPDEAVSHAPFHLFD